MPEGNEPRRGRRTGQPVDLWPIIESWSSTILKFAAAGIAISLGYLLYGALSGALNGNANGYVEPRIVYAIRVFGEILAVSSVVAAATLAIVTLEDIALSVVAAIYGLVLMLGTPFMITSNLHNARSAAAIQLNYWGTLAGQMVLAVVAIRIVYEIVQWVREAPTRRAAMEIREERTGGQIKKPTHAAPALMQRCWDMPFCHDRIKEICPAFKAHKTCWKFGRGCNCDPKLIENLIRMGGISGKGTRRDNKTARIEGEYTRTDLQADQVTNASERTIPCLKCTIYNEHQRQKFRLVNPVAIVLTVTAMAALYMPLRALYKGFIDLVSNLAASFSYGQTIDPAAWFEQLNTPAVQVFFFAIVFLLALAYVLKFVEWAVLVKKW